MTNHTADKSDALAASGRILQPGFQDYGGKVCFEGVVSTVKCHEDNSRVREALQQPGAQRILVVDGGASMNCALLGDMLATLGIQNNWAGVVVNGCIRDSQAIAGMAIGIKALNTHPKKSVKQGQGERDVAVTFSGVTIESGDYMYCDKDGILVSRLPDSD